MTEKQTDYSELLPLEVAQITYAKDRMSTFKLPSDPAEAASIKYDFTMNHVEGDESLREVLNFRRNAIKLRIGLNKVTDHGNNQEAHAASMIAIVSRMLHGSAKAAFEMGVAEQQRESWMEARVDLVVTLRNAENAAGRGAPNAAAEQAAADGAGAQLDFPPRFVYLEAGLNGIITVLAPFNALARVKRFMRRQCRKPDGMNIRTFATHFLRINNEELPFLPPFGVNNSLTLNEITEILQYAIPKNWNRKLQEQGKDPLSMTLATFVNVLEQIEGAEEYEPVPRKPKDNKAKSAYNGNKKPYNPNGNSDHNGSKKYCSYHGENTTHTSEQCKVLKSQNSSKNKTWVNKDSSQKKELASFIQKAIKKEMFSLEKTKKSYDAHKRKHNEVNNFELRNVESDAESVNLGDIDFDNMSLDSKATKRGKTEDGEEEEDDDLKIE